MSSGLLSMLWLWAPKEAAEKPHGCICWHSYNPPRRYPRASVARLSLLHPRLGTRRGPALSQEHVACGLHWQRRPDQASLVPASCALCSPVTR